MFNLHAKFGASYWVLILYGSYGLQLDIIHTDFKSGLESLLKAKPIRAIFLGVRIGDPTAVWMLSSKQDTI